MNEAEHLTDYQIAGYYAGGFAATETREIGRHLLLCAPCRLLLPAPSVEGFLAALAKEDETLWEEEASRSEKTKFSLSPFFSSSAEFFGRSRPFAWGGAATLVVLLSLSLLMWFAATRQSDSEGEVAQTFKKELNTERNEITKPIISSPSLQTPVNDNPVLSSKANGNAAAAKTTDAKPNAPKKSSNPASQNILNKNSKTIAPSGNQENISSTRGVGSSAPKCADEAAVEMTIGAAGETVTLKWKKVPRAAKYHLYVSDEEEILLDEFETAQGTSYVLKRPLDPLKTYKWKVVVTLENGDTVIGDSRKFTVRDLRFNQKKAEKKEKLDIRCSENIKNR